MTTRPKKKSFDAVAESRKWRVAAGRQLSGMTRSERISFLNERLEKLRSSRKKTLAHGA